MWGLNLFIEMEKQMDIDAKQMNPDFQSLWQMTIEIATFRGLMNTGLIFKDHISDEERNLLNANIHFEVKALLTEALKGESPERLKEIFEFVDDAYELVRADLEQGVSLKLTPS